MTISKCSVKLELALDDGMAWTNHPVRGLRRLFFDSGQQCIVGREPKLRRSIGGVYILSTLGSRHGHHTILRSKKVVPSEVTPLYKDTIPELRAWHILSRESYQDTTHSHELAAIDGLRTNIRSRLGDALASHRIYNISDREMDRWITFTTVELPETGEVRITATSRPIPVNLVRSV